MSVAEGENASQARMRRLQSSIPSTYTIYKDGSTFRAECNVAGGTDYSGTDAHSVIENAANAYSSNVLFFKPGTTYTSTNEIAVDNDLVIYAYGATIQGSESHTGGKLFDIADGKSFRMFGGTVDINNYFGVGIGADLNKAPALIHLEDVTIQNVYSYGISNGCNQTTTSTSPITLRNCSLTAGGGTDSLNELVMARPVNRIHIENCDFTGNKWLYVCGELITIKNCDFTAVGYTGAVWNSILSKVLSMKNIRADSASFAIRPYGSIHFDTVLSSALNISIESYTHLVTQTNIKALKLEGYDDTYGFENVSLKGINSARGGIEADTFTGKTHSFIKNLVINGVKIGVFDADNCVFRDTNHDIDNLKMASLHTPA